VCWQELSHYSVGPFDPRWANFTRINNPAFIGNSSASQPAFVVLPSSDADVQRAVECAFRNGLRVAVKAGGHSFAGYSTVASPGFMINLLLMKNITWNSDTVVSVQAGATWADVYSAFKSRGGLWVVTGGLCPSVGVAGFTQGGGVGPTARQFGLAADNLIAATVVLANASRVVRVDADSYPDLHWALRGGGGGNWGVVTELTFAVFRGPPLYTFGHYCINSTLDAVTALLELLSSNNADMPREVNVDLTYGSDAVCLWVVFQGPQSELADVLAPLLHAPTSPPLVSSLVKQFDCFHELIEFYALQKGYEQYDSQPYTLKNCLVNASGLKAMSQVLPSISVSVDCGVSLIHFGGRIGDHSPSHTAFPWRDAQYMLYASCGWTDADSERRSKKWLADFFLRIYSGGMCHGAYVNFIDPSQVNWPDAYYGSNLGKLRAVKAYWNAFGSSPLRFPQEIPAA
jgi:hypothetical protein